ncbi:MAG TPA: hypothetical protein IAB55_01020 [Candidatus Merdivicinus faecavium]|nr:hypothetical protein [Candidatus Merdivicinus faecavium]
MFYKKNTEPALSAELFQNPTAEYRGTPFWAWNCTLDNEILDEQIAYLKEMGFGGFHMHPRTGFGNPYLSAEHMGLVKHCVETAKKEQMYAYLYDEDRWPSGAAGGIVTKDPKYRERYLCFTTVPYGLGAGEALGATAAVTRSENGTLLACYDVVLDSSGCLKHYSRIRMEGLAEGTKWYAYLETPLCDPWYNNQTYVNTLSKEAIDKFIEVTYETYKQTIAEDFGGAVPSIFTDEPQFSHKNTLNFPDESKDVILPWTEDLADTFAEAYGEDLIAHLPQLIWELPGGRVSLIRYHYHDHITERFTEAFADNCGRWCGENGLMLTGHMMEEPTLRSQTAALGEAMRAYRGFQMPGIDMLCHNFEYTTAKQAQSAVHQYGREGMLSELYGVTGWSFDFRGHKIQGDWQAALGVTVRVPHLSWVSMAGEAKRDYPASINYQSPWYKEYPLVEDHFARVNTALTRGRPVVRIGVIHPIESYWLHWGPAQQTSLVREQMEENFQNLTEWLLFGSLDFDFICESLLPDLCPQGGAPLKVGEMAYDAVIVPACETLRATTLERLEAFRAQGGRLIFLGDAPRLLDARESDLPAALCARAEQRPFTRSAVLEALEEFREVELRGADGSYLNHMLYQLRQDNGCRWLFLAQGKEPPLKDNARAEKVRVTLRGMYKITCYDTMTGEIYPMAAECGEGRTVLRRTFYNHDSLLLKLEPLAEDVLAVHSEPLHTACHRTGENCWKVPDLVPVTLEEPNVLLLDKAEYALDGGEYFPAEEILRADNVLRGLAGFPLRGSAVAQPWTIPEEPFVHTARLRFAIHSETAVSDVSLALEDAERARIRWNGREIPAEITGFFTDKAIKTVALGTLMPGENTLELELPFGRRTDLEWCYLLGDFGVRVSGERATVTAPVRALGFGDITAQGLPFYGGNVIYHLPVPVEGKLLIHLPHYRGALVGVSAEGRRLGSIAFAPYNLMCDAPADGVLDLTLFGNRQNSFGAVHRRCEGNNWLGPDAWRTKGDEWSESYQLLPAGILSAPVIWVQK